MTTDRYRPRPWQPLEWSLQGASQNEKQNRGGGQAEEEQQRGANQTAGTVQAGGARGTVYGDNLLTQTSVLDRRTLADHHLETFTRQARTWASQTLHETHLTQSLDVGSCSPNIFSTTLVMFLTAAKYVMNGQNVLLRKHKNLQHQLMLGYVISK